MRVIYSFPNRYLPHIHSHPGRLIAGLLLATSPIFSIALPTPTVRADPILLTDRQMDRVTASGAGILADSLADAAGLGADGFSSTTATASVGPTSGLAVATGEGIGPDGSSATVSVIVTGEDGSRVIATGADADAVNGGIDGTLVGAEGTIHRDAQGVSGASVAVTEGGSGVVLSTTQLATISGVGGRAGLAEADALADNGEGAVAATSLSEAPRGSGWQIVTTSEGNGSFATTFSGTASETTLQGVTVEMSGSGETAGGTATSRSTQALSVGSNGLIARVTGEGADGSFGQASDASVGLGGATTSPILIDRSTHRGGISRSLSITVIPRQ